MRFFLSLLLGIAIICGEVFLGAKTFYPELAESKADIVDEIMETKKSVVDKLSQEQLAWIALNPTVTVGADPNFYPLETFDERGQYTGLGGDYVRLLNYLTGIDFRVIRQGDWASSEGLAQDKQVDMFVAIAQTKRRSEFMNFTDAYVKLPGVVMTLRGSGLDKVSIEDLANKKVAVVANYSWHDFLIENHPEIEIVLAANTADAIYLVVDGKADAVIDYEFNLMEKIQSAGILQMQGAGSIDSTFGHAMAAHKDNQILLSILEQALAEIAPDERESLSLKWLSKSRPAGEERRLQWYFFFFTQATLLCLGIIGWANGKARNAVITRMKVLQAKTA